MKPFLRRIVVALCLGLMAVGGVISRAQATINSTVNKTIVLGDGVATTFNFAFVGVAAAYISVIFTDASGNETVLTSGAGATQYQISLNPPATGAIWGLGGTVTYNPSGTPIPAGSTLTIFRTLPLTQAISLQRMNSLSTLGNGAETGLDTGAMQLQQVSENIARAIVAPIVDATPPAPLPPIAQRANHGAAFDGQGNLVAGVTPSSGVISSAMQPVVNAATLAAGRAAFGLGNVATENIGCGLQDDGSGNLRVGASLTSVAINQAVDASFCNKSYIATGPITFTLARSNTLWNGFTFTVYAFAGSITLTPNINDNFPALAGGVSYTVPAGSVARITTDAANTGTWYVQLVPQAVTPPQGYLTPCSASVAVTGCTVPGLVPTGDVSAVSTLYYQTAPAGNQIPLYNGGIMMMLPFPELVLTLNSNHLANTIYDACIFNNGGVPTIATAPAWQTSTAGSGARGTAAAITRTAGYWTNNLAITGRNGASTYAIAAHACTIVSTISIGASPGAVSFHRTAGQVRRWDASNIYNRQAITLAVTDATASWFGGGGSIFRVSRGDANNYALVLNSVAEEVVSAQFSQQVVNSYGNNSILTQLGIGINSTSASSSMNGLLSVSDNISGSFTTGGSPTARVEIAPALGLNQLYSLEYTTAAGTVVTFSGQSPNMRMSASWRG